MRILLDECLPRRLAAELTGHDVTTVSQSGWSGVKNGELLQLAAAEFDALLTIDQRFAEGATVPATLALITIATNTNRLESIRPVVPALLAVLAAAPRGKRTRVGG